MAKLIKSLCVYRWGRSLIATFAFLLLFTSCNNLFEDHSNQNYTSETTQKYVTVSGFMNMDGAIPSELAQLYQCHAELLSASPDETPKQVRGDSIDSRTAFPSLPTSDITYIVKAVCKDDSSVFYSGTLSSDNSSYTVGIPVQSEQKDYYIESR